MPSTGDGQKHRRQNLQEGLFPFPQTIVMECQETGATLKLTSFTHFYRANSVCAFKRPLPSGGKREGDGEGENCVRARRAENGAARVTAKLMQRSI